MDNELFLNIRKKAVIKINIDNYIEYANDYVLNLMNYGLMELISQRPKIVCHDDMPDIIHNTIGGFIMNYQEGIAVLKHKTKNNDYFWALTYFKPSYNKDGSFEAFLTHRKPLPSKKLNGTIEDLKYQISKLYEILKGIESHTGEKPAEKYLEGFLEYKGFDSLKDYYMSFFNFNKKELEEYFAIDDKTSEKKIKRYSNVITIF